MQRFVLPIACALLSACTTLAPGYADLSLENLFNAERAFARDAHEHGVRASFLRHFAADAIVFQPAPIRYADLVGARPAPADPLATLIEWGPQAGAVSRAGDLGFTTGPTRISDRHDPKAPVAYGYYFSIWSRASGEWRVIVDAGVSQSSPPPQEGVPNMRTPIFRGDDLRLDETQRATDRDALLSMERMPRGFGEVPGVAAYRDLVTPSTRWLRSGPPAMTGNTLVAYLAREPAGRVEWTPVDGAIAASGDLAWTYGRSRRFVGAQIPVDGYYVHVWQRRPGSAWKLIADVSLPAS